MVFGADRSSSYEDLAWPSPVELKNVHVPTLNMDRIRVDIDGDIEEVTDVEFLVLWQLQDINPSQSGCRDLP